jgi:hypothetical protein
MRYSGILSHAAQSVAAPARVVAVVDRRLLAAMPVGPDGRWTLDPVAQPQWIVAQCRRLAVAAVAAPPDAAHLRFPDLVELELEQDGAEKVLTVWVDPVELVGFPHDLIWSLFAEPDDVVELHVAELQLPPRGKRVTIPVQRGRFRLSGGTVALSPRAGLGAVQLAGVTHIDTGIRIPSQAGQAIIDIHGPARYRLDFETYDGRTGFSPVT